MKLTGMSSYKAVKDLNRLTEEGRLRRYGRGRNVIYLPINANGEV
jgi:predicted transcriptional regulator of viral defense system